MFLRLSALSIALCGLLAATVLPEEVTPRQQNDKQEKLARLCLTGMWDGRERLRSGAVRAMECKTGKSALSGADIAHFLAFDFDRNCLRFDRGDGRQLPKHTREPFTKYARNQSCSLFFDRTGVTKRAPDWEVDIGGARPFDIRIVGLVPLVCFEYRWSYDEVRDSFEEKGLPQVRSSEGSSVYQLIWDFVLEGERRRRQTVWVDAEKAFSPVRMEFCKVRSQPDGSTSDEILASSKTLWIESSDVWVPEKWVVFAHTNDRRLEMTFTWESANETIPDELFQVDGFDLRKGTPVVNMRLGTPIVESYFGIDMIAPGPPPAEARPTWRTWLLAMTLVVCLATSIVLSYRARLVRGGA